MDITFQTEIKLTYIITRIPYPHSDLPGFDFCIQRGTGERKGSPKKKARGAAKKEKIAAWKRADEYCTFFDSKPNVALSRIKQQMHREVGHCSMLQIVRNIRDNMEFLELPGGGSHQPSTGIRRTGGARAVEFEDDLVSFRDPGHRAGPGGFD